MRLMQGEILLLSVRTVDGNETPVLPDRAPLATIYSGTVAKISFRVPIADSQAVTGLFKKAFQLNSLFPAGRYAIAYSWSVSGTFYGEVQRFEVVAGGAADGSGVGCAFLRAPAADWVLVQTKSGRVLKKRNPRIS